MASPNPYPGGLNLTGTVFDGGPTDFELGPVWLSGLVQFVDTISGSNVNSGAIPELPVATLAQAVTNSAANGVIVIGQGSAESLSGSQVINLAGLWVAGCGIGSTRPRYTCTGAVDMLSLTAAGILIENLYFPQSTAAATSRIAFTAANGEVRDCYFECGASDTNRALRVHTGANSTRVESCSFAVTASRPAIGLEVSAAVTDTTLVDLTFDGGSYGWSDYALKVSAAATRVRARNLAMTNRSRYGHTVTATSYQLFGINEDGMSTTLLTA